MAGSSSSRPTASASAAADGFALKPVRSREAERNRRCHQRAGYRRENDHHAAEGAATETVTRDAWYQTRRSSTGGSIGGTCSTKQREPRRQGEGEGPALGQFTIQTGATAERQSPSPPASYAVFPNSEPVLAANGSGGPPCPVERAVEACGRCAIPHDREQIVRHSGGLLRWLMGAWPS
jgi:hypothetical protein